MAVTVGSGILSKGGAVLEASDGTKIAVFLNSTATSLYVYKNIDGTPSLVDTEGVGAIHGLTEAVIGWIDAAIDSNDDIKVVSACSSEQTRDVAYAVCNLTTGFGAWTEAADYTEQAPVLPGCAISIDSNDYPHILFVDNVKTAGSAQDNIYYDYNDGTWNGAEQVGVRGTKTYYYRYPKITLASADDVEAFYYGVEGLGYAMWRRRNGTWGTQTNIANNNIDGNDITITTGDTAYRTWTDASGDIFEGSADVGYNTDTLNKSISTSLVGTDRYIFYIDTSDDVHVISNSGSGWTDESAQQTGTYLRVIAQWSYLNNGQSGEINYIFDDGTNVYYDSFSISATTQVYKDTQLKWDMREFVHDDIQIKWDIFDLVYKDIQAIWDIFDTVYKDLQAVWDMRELVYQDIEAIWDMSGAVSKDLQAVWDIFDTVYKDTELKWDILDLVGKELQSIWDIKELIGQELQAKWDIRELVYQDIELVWDILSLATQVFKDLQAKWDIRELIGKDIQAKWDILNLVNKSIEARYDIQELVGRELQSVWDILNLVGQEVQAKWDISVLVTKSIEAKWDILNLVNNSINAIWDVHELVGRSLVARWDILNGAPPEEGGGKVGLRQIAYRWTRKVGR